MIKSVYAITANVIAKLLAQGLRVVIDGFCRIKLEPRGKMDDEDSVWDPAKNSIAAVVIPATEIRNAANDIEGENLDCVAGYDGEAKSCKRRLTGKRSPDRLREIDSVDL